MIILVRLSFLEIPEQANKELKEEPAGPGKENEKLKKRKK